MDAMGDDATTTLRAQRDALALRIEKIHDQGETAFDTFRSELDEDFDVVERALGFN